MAEVESFDLVVIGSGPAGEKGAALASQAGKRVAVIERMKQVGGACVHTGTVPSKTLRETALYLTGFRRRQLYGMTLKLDRGKGVRQLMGRLRDVTQRQVHQIRRNLERHAITLYRGVATFEDAHTVVVKNDEGERRLRAEYFLVATGSSPVPPRGITFEDPDVVDSDRLLDLDRIPRTMAVVGGGVIGCEYACLFAALGTEVTLIEGRDRLLGFIDYELSSAVKIALERMGGEVRLGDAVEGIMRVPGAKTNALRMKLKSGKVLRTDKVLFSAGRAGNTAGMNLEALGVNIDERGRIAVDEHFRTSVPHIYAAGDVVGNPALASTSMEQGRIAAAHMFDAPYRRVMSTIVPYGIYTIPEIAYVGATEEELKDRRIPYEVGRARYENNARGQITGEHDGMLKLLFDPESKRLLGAHIIGADATELIHLAQFVLAHEGTIEEFVDSVFNFPSYSDCYKYAALDGLQRLQRDAKTQMTCPMPSAPGARPWFVGIDLADPTSVGAYPVVVAVMDRHKRIRFGTWTYNEEGVGLIPGDIQETGYVLAINGPQGLPRPGAKKRLCEELLLEMAPRSAKGGLRGHIAASPEGSLKLFSTLRKELHRCGLHVLGEGPQDRAALIEVDPDHLYSRLLGKAPAKKTTPQGRRQRYDLLRGLGIELPMDAQAITHDQLDAAAAAYGAYIWATGQAQRIGDKPYWDEEAGVFREGWIISV